MLKILNYFLIVPIKLYQILLSPLIGPTCRFTPTCSNYAIEAINNHKSLLPAGVIKAIGNFERGDAVEIISENNEKVGQGLSGYSYYEVEKIKGCKSNEIEEKLGHPGRVALIHIDDLVLS